MNTQPSTRIPASQWLATSAALFGSLLLFNGCARKPIIVQAPPATVINQTTPAPAPSNNFAPVQKEREVIVVKEAPPAPRSETQPVQPSSEYVWIKGYWAWRNNQQTWVAGRWEIPPRAEAQWIEARWERSGDGYSFVEGYWR